MKRFKKQICIRLEDKYYEALNKIIQKESKKQSEYIREVLVKKINEDVVQFI